MRERIYYGWVVLITYLIIGTCILGIRFSFGVFFKSIEVDFGLTRTVTSGVFSAHLILSAICGIFGGWALDKYGPRAITLWMGLFTGLSLILTSQANSAWHLFMSYSLLLAIGSGATYTVMTSTEVRWFQEKRGLVTGIVTSSTGLGMVAVSPVAAYLISGFGWQTSFFTMGLGAWLIVLPLSLLLKREPGQIANRASGTVSGASQVQMRSNEGSGRTGGFSLPQASRTRSFWLILAAWFLFSSSFYLGITHTVPYATDVGLSGVAAAMVISLIGGASIGGMVLVGKLSDSMGRKSPAIGCALLEASALIWLVWSHELWMFYIFAALFGFAFGGITSTITALIGDTFGAKSIGIIMGVLAAGFQFGAAIGPVIGGLVFDATSDYSLAFFSGGLVMLIVAVLLALTRQEQQ